MAEKRKSSALARLIPNAQTIAINGQDIIVPSNKDENHALNMIVISQGRALIQEAMKKWKDQGETPSPKELKDILEAMKSCVDTSTEIYEKAEPIEEKKTLVAQEQHTSLGEIKFDLTKKPDGDKPSPPNPQPAS